MSTRSSASRLLAASGLAVLGLSTAFAQPGPGLGVAITPGDAAPWDISIQPNGTGLPAAVLAPATRELGWLAGLTERRKPFDAVAHCLCTVPF